MTPARLLLALLLVSPSSFCLADITITGINDDQIRKNFRNMLSLNKQTCEAPQWKVARLVRRVDDELQSALRPYGYYHASAEKKLTFGKECWNLDIQVQQGPPVILKKALIRIDGEADSDDTFETRLADVRPYIGDRLEHAQYKKIKQTIQSVALDRGYLDGRFSTSQLQVNIDTNEAEFTLIYDSGPRYRFGLIKIDQDVLSPEFINRIIGLEPNEPYSSKAIIKLRSSLSNSGYFTKVAVNPELDEKSDNMVPVSISLTPSKKHHFSAGVGFDTDIGPTLTGSYTNRRFNMSGHKLGASLQLSPVESSVTTSYTIPLNNPNSDKVTFALGYTHEDTDSYISDQFTFSTSLTQALENSWKRTIYADLKQEDYETEDDDEEETLLFIPGVRWNQTIADNVLRTTKGHMFSFEVNGSHEAIISDVTFIRFVTEGAIIRQLWPSGTFIGRTKLGATLVKDFEDLPTSQRFFAGGAQTIRGYQYKELGPTDEDGDVVGGRFLGIISGEYEHAIFDDWAIAGFVDTGNAFNENRITLKTGVGGGIRWYSPIGPIRVDLAFPMNESDSSFQIHFATGPRW